MIIEKSSTNASATLMLKIMIHEKCEHGVTKITMSHDDNNAKDERRMMKSKNYQRSSMTKEPSSKFTSKSRKIDDYKESKAMSYEVYFEE